MKTQTKIACSVLVAAVVVAAVIVAYPFLFSPGERVLRFGAAEEKPFGYEDYAAALSQYVDEKRMVDYRGLKANSDDLDAFAAALGTLSAETYEGWTEEQKIAFWVNAYNALTLEAIIAHYPIQASLGKSLVYPKNSIRQIPGVWKKLQFVVMGETRTLNDIEHGILRVEFNEPRIHMALVCAAMGCPPLRNEPFVGDRLGAQLDDQTRRFLANPEKFRMDAEAGRVFLSPIFKWFGSDFVETYGTDEAFAGHGEAERAVLNFIRGSLDEERRKVLERDDLMVSYLDYDWSLNEQAGSAKSE